MVLPIFRCCGKVFIEPLPCNDLGVQRQTRRLSSDKTRIAYKKTIPTKPLPNNDIVHRLMEGIH
jgi:hypothetical protein